MQARRQFRANAITELRTDKRVTRGSGLILCGTASVHGKNVVGVSLGGVRPVPSSAALRPSFILPPSSFILVLFLRPSAPPFILPLSAFILILRATPSFATSRIAHAGDRHRIRTNSAAQVNREAKGARPSEVGQVNDLPPPSLMSYRQVAHVTSPNNRSAFRRFAALPSVPSSLRPFVALPLRPCLHPSAFILHPCLVPPSLRPFLHPRSRGFPAEGGLIAGSFRTR